MSIEKGLPNASDPEAEIDGHLEEIRKAFEASDDEDERTHHLIMALNFAPWRLLPDWAVTEIRRRLSLGLSQEPDLHSPRWLEVLQAKQSGKSWITAYKLASKTFEGTPYKGRQSAMRDSYQKFNRWLRRRR